MAYDYSQSGWSPEVVDYATRLAAQRDALVGKYAGMNTGLDNPDFLTPMQVQQPASDEIRTEYMPEEVVRAFMAKYPTISEAAFNPGVDIISYGASRDPAVYDVVRVPYGVKYTYTDKAADKSGMLSTPEELGAFARSRNLATGRGNNVANWELTDPSGKRLASDLPYTPSFLKKYGPYIGAAALAAIVGPAAFASMTAPAAGAAGAGAAGAGAAGAGAGTLAGAGAAGAGAAGAGTGAGLGAALGAGVTEAVTVGALAPSMFSLAAPYVAGGTLGALTAAQLAQLATPPSIPTDPYVTPTEEAVVSANKLKPFKITPNLSALTAASAIPAVTLASSLAPPEIPAEEPSALDKYLRYASAGLTGASLLSGLVGGGGAGSKGGAGTISGDGGKMPANFSDKLPTGDAIPAYGGGTNRQLRDLSGVDWKTYGFRPGIDFYENVPTPPKAAAKGGSMAVKRPAKSYAVQGEGDGRSDDIPAVLSDGEYVIDAETVALLGNGSNKAGAAQLDRFRANIRKHKGKELAKGRFSVNAKNPQAYLAGGRT
jgi:hypothetical protein